MISIIIPTYEQEGWGHRMLRPLLATIEMQKMKDYEIVISDNSFDNKIEKLVFNIPKLTYIRNFRRGVGANTNNAIAHAKYDTIKPMYMDDVFMNTSALEIFYRKAQNGWCISNSRYIDMGGKTIGFVNARFNSKIFKINTIGMPSVVCFKKGVVMDEQLRSLVDMVFYHELHRKYGNPKVVQSDLVGQRIWHSSISEIQGDQTPHDKAIIEDRYKWIHEKMSS